MPTSSQPWTIVSAGPSLQTWELANQFLQAKKSSGLSPHTLSNYQVGLRSLVNLSPELPLTANEIERWLDSLSFGSDETKAKVFRQVRTFYKWLVRRGILARDQDPMDLVDRPKVRRKLPRDLTQAQLRRVVQVSKPPWERSLILVLVDSGARIGELEGLNKDSIQGDCLHLNSGKTGERLAAISPMTREYLEGLPTYYLFPTQGFHGRRPNGEVQDRPLTKSGMQQQVRRVMRRAKIKGPKLGPHRFRHTFGTDWIEQGGDVVTLARALGHSGVVMASRYVGTSMRTLQDHHRKYSPLNLVSGMMPATVPDSRPPVELPGEVRLMPLTQDGHEIVFTLVKDQRANHMYYYIRARVVYVNRDGRSPGRSPARWTVCSLGTDLSLELADGYELAVERENQRRMAEMPPHFRG